MKWLLCLLFCGNVYAKESSTNCLATALYRECSGCSARGQKAVLEVIENRAHYDRKSICAVVKSSAFPWSARQQNWKPSQEALTIFFRARRMTPVVGKGVYYFNNEKMSYGRFAVRIEDHLFYYRI